MCPSHAGQRYVGVCDQGVCALARGVQPGCVCTGQRCAARVCVHWPEVCRGVLPGCVCTGQRYVEVCSQGVCVLASGM
jgi:hypothetical protein